MPNLRRWQKMILVLVAFFALTNPSNNRFKSFCSDLKSPELPESIRGDFKISDPEDLIQVAYRKVFDGLVFSIYERETFNYSGILSEKPKTRKRYLGILLNFIKLEEE